RGVEGERSCYAAARIKWRFIKKLCELRVWRDRCRSRSEVNATGIREVEGDRCRLVVRIRHGQTGVDRPIHLRINPSRPERWSCRHTGFRNKNSVLAKTEDRQPGRRCVRTIWLNPRVADRWGTHP